MVVYCAYMQTVLHVSQSPILITFPVIPNTEDTPLTMFSVTQYAYVLIPFAITPQHINLLALNIDFGRVTSIAVFDSCHNADVPRKMLVALPSYLNRLGIAVPDDINILIDKKVPLQGACFDCVEFVMVFLRFLVDGHDFETTALDISHETRKQLRKDMCMLTSLLYWFAQQRLYEPADATQLVREITHIPAVPTLRPFGTYRSVPFMPIFASSPKSKHVDVITPESVARSIWTRCPLTIDMNTNKMALNTCSCVILTPVITRGPGRFVCTNIISISSGVVVAKQGHYTLRWGDMRAMEDSAVHARACVRAIKPVAVFYLSSENSYKPAIVTSDDVDIPLPNQKQIEHVMSLLASAYLYVIS